MNRRTTDPQPGVRAKYATECPRCPNGIAVGDRIVFITGVPTHCSCHMRDHE